MSARAKNLLGWLLAGLVGVAAGLALQAADSGPAHLAGAVALIFGGAAVLVGGGNLILDLVQAKDADSGDLP